jgi:uncharacterized phage protein gp47/JayE
MAYPIPSFEEIENTILNEIRGETGLTLEPDSDAAVRAAGTAAACEGLFDHQIYIGRQLFILTADEAGLVLHGQRLNLPRLGGSIATGQVTTLGATDGVSLPLGARVTDGNGNYWSTTLAGTLLAGQNVTVPIAADAVGATWNKPVGTVLTWVSPVSGQQAQANVVELSGGSDGEALESWRVRLLEAERLGASQGRDADFVLAAKSVAGVRDAYPYRMRRGIGSMDVAVTAFGSGTSADLPSPALLALVQVAIQAVAVGNEDVRAFAPNATPINVTAILTGTGIDIAAAELVINNYLDGLQPAEPFIVIDLGVLLRAQTGVTDVALTPSANMIPVVNTFHLDWFRAGTVQVNP